MRANILFMAMAIAAFCGLISAASGPVMQLQNYTLTPSTVYAGTVGYLQATIKNAGDDVASDAYASYDINGIGSTMAIGDVSVGSSAQVAIPFKISEEAAGGIQVVSAEIIYYAQTTSGSGAMATSSARRLTLQVPLEVSQKTPFEVNTISSDKPSVSPGEKVSFVLELSNSGGIVNNVVITTPANSSFALDGTSKKEVGTIQAGMSRNITLTLMSSSSAQTGTYTIPVVFTYYDKTNRPTDATISIGPISVTETSSQYRLEIEPPAPAEIGAQTVLRLKLSNVGTQPISAYVDANSTDIFTPIGMQRIYFDSIAPGSAQTKDLTLGVLPTATAGYYSLPLKLTPSVGSASVQYAGLLVQASPQITATVQVESGSSPQLMIANVGNTAIRSMYVKVAYKNNQKAAATESFIGTLNVDDYSTVTLIETAAMGSPAIVSAEIHFKDSRNVERTITKEIEVPSSLNGAYGGIANSSSTRSFGNRGQSNSPLGFLMGPGARGAASGSAAGNDLPIVPVVGGIVVLAVAFFAYKRFAKKKDAPKPAVAQAGAATHSPSASAHSATSQKK